jgi:5-methylcytosine-specific restriction protein B
MIKKLLKEFSEQYKIEVKEKYGGNLRSYKILVNEIPSVIKKDIGIEISKITGSIGKGNSTYYPWIGFFDYKVSTGATNGFYVVLLFSDDFNDVYLTLNQGSTVQAKDDIESNRNFVYGIYPNIDGFTKGILPRGSLVRVKNYTSTNKGMKYEKTNIFYKKFIISELNQEQFIADLKKILHIYKDCAEKFIKKKAKVNDLHKLDKIQSKLKTTFKMSKSFIDIGKSNLCFSQNLVFRFCTSLLSKPFVILTGLSGSGKTKLAQTFSEWICENNSQYCLLPVGADWTNREPLLGYPNALENGRYVKPENGVLDLILNAQVNPVKPYFLILDEMNLSHVERYFADFLSAMESGESIPLHPDTDEWKDDNGNWKDGIPDKIKLPSNLFFVGTVNIDETTYMFSPKVLDRANVIEFRVTDSELENFLKNPAKPKLELIKGKGAGMATDFVSIANAEVSDFNEIEVLNSTLVEFFKELKITGAEFGYRTATEIHSFCSKLNTLTKKEDITFTIDEMIDAAVLQKLLPKLHGSRKKLETVLNSLAVLCLVKEEKQRLLSANQDRNQNIGKLVDETVKIDENIRFKLSMEKILRMKKRVIQDGFTSFAEA